MSDLFETTTISDLGFPEDVQALLRAEGFSLDKPVLASEDGFVIPEFLWDVASGLYSSKDPEGPSLWKLNFRGNLLLLVRWSIDSVVGTPESVEYYTGVASDLED